MWSVGKLRSNSKRTHQRTHWVFCEWTPWVLSHFVQNVPTMNLSHSLIVLSKNTQKCIHNVPNGFFSKNLQRTLNSVQFYHKLSKNSLSIWLSILWSYIWVLFERTLNEWLRFIAGTFWTKLWKDPGGSFTKYPVGSLMGSFWIWSQLTHWSHWNQSGE